jgi:hypothetical protein
MHKFPFQFGLCHLLAAAGCTALHRFLQRLVPAGGMGEVGVGDLQVVLVGIQFRIARPEADDVQWVGRHQLRLPA